MTWTNITEARTNPGAPASSELFKDIVSNIISVPEGGDGAPRVLLKALERLAPGSEIRSQSTEFVQPAIFTAVLTISFMQVGSVRCSVSFVSGNASASRHVSRTRNKVQTVLHDAPSDIVLDVDVLPGDQIVIGGEGASSSGATLFASIGTDGQSIWPSAFSTLEGNDV